MAFSRQYNIIWAKHVQESYLSKEHSHLAFTGVHTFRDNVQ
uniref:Uncharacterized protein n=1 Tax=Rhizophora mucronata TaxID=61149 RepID=A0A2P2NSZ9_RHIMU